MTRFLSLGNLAVFHLLIQLPI